MTAVRKSSPRPWGCFSPASQQAACSHDFPRPWGCFRGAGCCFGAVHVFPTPVGVFLSRTLSEIADDRLPHARGGVSIPRRDWCIETWSSPRLWGCFSPASQQAACSHVFPTPVGVFPNGFRKRCWPRCLPHARGGVSTSTGAGLNSVRRIRPIPRSCSRRVANCWSGGWSLGWSAVMPREAEHVRLAAVCAGGCQ